MSENDKSTFQVINPNKTEISSGMKQMTSFPGKLMSLAATRANRIAGIAQI